jgi:hypothetical protein
MAAANRPGKDFFAFKRFVTPVCENPIPENPIPENPIPEDPIPENRKSSPRSAVPLSFRAERANLETLYGLLAGSRGQNLALTVLYVPFWSEEAVSYDRGTPVEFIRCVRACVGHEERTARRMMERLAEGLLRLEALRYPYLLKLLKPNARKSIPGN